MKNKLSDLNNHLFAQLERLSDESITPEQLEHEARHGDVLAKVADQITRIYAVQLQAAKVASDAGIDCSPYLPKADKFVALPGPAPSQREAALLRVVEADRSLP